MANGEHEHLVSIHGDTPLHGLVGVDAGVVERLQEFEHFGC